MPSRAFYDLPCVVGFQPGHPWPLYPEVWFNTFPFCRIVRDVSGWSLPSVRIVSFSVCGELSAVTVGPHNSATMDFGGLWTSKLVRGRIRRDHRAGADAAILHDSSISGGVFEVLTGRAEVHGRS